MAAGLGFKDFVTGEVLTAADVDGYLMQGVWVFASAAARDAAVTSPQEGNFAYLKDTNVTTYYTGSAWANLDTTGMTNPMTTTGDTIYSSSGSTPARLGIGTTGQVLTVAGGVPSWATPAGGATFVGVSCYLDGAVSVADDTQVILGWNAENFDSNGFHDNSTNNSRLTVPSGKAGKYLVTSNLVWAANATGTRVSQIRVNGTLIALSANSVNSGSYEQSVFIGTTLNLSVGDYVEIWVIQNRGGSLNVGATSTWYSSFTMSYLGA
jgi:hypothetical protein